MVVVVVVVVVVDLIACGVHPVSRSVARFSHEWTLTITTDTPVPKENTLHPNV